MAGMREQDIPGRLGELIRFGTVASVDLAGARITVEIGDITTAPIRWLTGASGGTRSWSAPVVGEQLLVPAPEGDLAGAVALRGVICDPFPPAGNSTRDLVQFADGAVLAYDPGAHALEAVLPAGAPVSIVAPGGVNIRADVRIQGDLDIDGAVRATGIVTSDADVTAGSISLKSHRHAGVQAGGSKTAVPE